MTYARDDFIDVLNAVKWNSDGLVPAIVQEVETNEVLMMAWMNRLALQRTLETQRGVYWSRSRKRLWVKGEESGHTQNVQEIRLDCDSDTVLLKVNQIGGIACHTGRRSCFYNIVSQGAIQEEYNILKQPHSIYRSNKGE